MKNMTLQAMQPLLPLQLESRHRQHASGCDWVSIKLHLPKQAVNMENIQRTTTQPDKKLVKGLE